MFNKRKSNDVLTAPQAEVSITPALQALQNVASGVAASVSRPDAAASKTRQVPIAPLSSSEKPSIISEGFSITGDLNSSGTLHVEGKISGRITAHTITISPIGTVDGEVTCSSLNIKGTFSGKAKCEDLVIASSSHVKGVIGYRFVTIGAGATVEGELSVSA